MSGKLPGRPNLSLAGKREAPGAAPKAESKRGRGGGRGAGRGGRGGRGGKPPKQELIQTGGVFSEGLGGDFPSKKTVVKEVEPQQFTVKKASTTTAKSPTPDETPKPRAAGKTSFKNWDQLWESDEETDELEKKALLPRRGIVSDLTHGSIMPCVLPAEDQPQFMNVLNKNARFALELEEKSGGAAAGAEMNVEDKKPNLTQKNPRKTAEQIISMFEASTSELMHLQLPSVISSICREIEEKEEIPMETDEFAEPQEKGGDLPSGRNIGKIQVTKKGRILLRIGGHVMDITAKAVNGKQMGTVLLETEPQMDSMGSPIQSTDSSKNAIYYLGNVKHNLVGSMSWNELNRTKTEENTEKVVENDANNDTPMLDAAQVRKIQELEEVQKSWAGFAEKWAKGK